MPPEHLLVREIRATMKPKLTVPPASGSEVDAHQSDLADRGQLRATVEVAVSHRLPAGMVKTSASSSPPANRVRYWATSLLSSAATG
jgi:hypothetical protein